MKTIDIPYFREKLSLVVRDLESYAIDPADLARQLVRYARVADELAAIDECRYSEKEINARVNGSTDDDPDYCAHSYEQNGFCPECGNTKTTVSAERMTDNINPSHYKKGGIECVEAIKAATVGKTGIEAVCTANVIKYVWRYEDKNGVEDLRKALWYLERLIKEVAEK